MKNTAHWISSDGDLMTKLLNCATFLNSNVQNNTLNRLDFLVPIFFKTMKSFSSTFQGKFPIFKADWKIKHFSRQHSNSSLFKVCGNHVSESQQTPQTLPSRASYGVSIVRILAKIDRIIKAPHCMISVLPLSCAVRSIMLYYTLHDIMRLYHIRKPSLWGHLDGLTQEMFFKTLRLRQNCHHFANDIFKCIFLNENV